MSAPPSTSAGEDMGDSVRRKRSRRLFDDDLASASQPSGAGTTLPATEFGAQSASADASSNESESETDDEHEHMANKLLRSLVKASKTGNADRAPLRGGISAMWKMHERLRAANHRKVRRWCLYEFVYPAIDVPFFAHNEFETCLQQLGLSRVTKLALPEWRLVRRMISREWGTPRRLSPAFLADERSNLRRFREDTRQRHAIHAKRHPQERLSTRLAVGSQVVAAHPKSKEMERGTILTADTAYYWVQFDDSELGVQLVPDTQVMSAHFKGLYADVPHAPASATEEPVLDEVAAEAVAFLLQLVGDKHSLVEQLRQLPVGAAESSSAAVRADYGQVTARLRECNAKLRPLLQKVKAFAALGSTARKHGLRFGARAGGPRATTPPDSALPNGTGMMWRGGALGLGQTLSSYHAVATDYVRRVKHECGIRSIVSPDQQPMREGSAAVEETIVGASPTADAAPLVSALAEAAAAELHVAIDDSSTAADGARPAAAEGAAGSGASTLGVGVTPDPDGNLGVTRRGEQLISSCIALMLLLQQNGGSDPAAVRPGDMAVALDLATVAIKPEIEENMPTYRDIEAVVGQLKASLL